MRTRISLGNDINLESGKFAHDIRDKAVTHYLIQNNLSTKEFNSLKKFCANNVIRLASINWLRDCLKERKLLDMGEYPVEQSALVDAFNRTTIHREMQPPLRKRHSYQQNVRSEPRRRFRSTHSLSLFENQGASKMSEDISDREIRKAQEHDKARFFSRKDSESPPIAKKRPNDSLSSDDEKSQPAPKKTRKGSIGSDGKSKI